MDDIDTVMLGEDWLEESPSQWQRDRDWLNGLPKADLVWLMTQVPPSELHNFNGIDAYHELADDPIFQEQYTGAWPIGYFQKFNYTTVQLRDFVAVAAACGMDLSTLSLRTGIPTDTGPETPLLEFTTQIDVSRSRREVEWSAFLPVQRAHGATVPGGVVMEYTAKFDTLEEVEAVVATLRERCLARRVIPNASPIKFQPENADQHDRWIAVKHMYGPEWYRSRAYWTAPPDDVPLNVASMVELYWR